jgi:hypothetical protein
MDRFGACYDTLMCVCKALRTFVPWTGEVMSTPTVDDFRAEIARQQRTRYELAAQVGIHAS